jgi:hypothetical protein
LAETGERRVCFERGFCSGLLKRSRATKSLIPTIQIPTAKEIVHWKVEAQSVISVCISQAV